MAAPLASVLSRLRAADQRARAYQAGGAPALLKLLQQQLAQLAAQQIDPRPAVLARR